MKLKSDARRLLSLLPSGGAHLRWGTLYLPFFHPLFSSLQVNFSPFSFGAGGGGKASPYIIATDSCGESMRLAEEEKEEEEKEEEKEKEEEEEEEEKRP